METAAQGAAGTAAPGAASATSTSQAFTQTAPSTSLSTAPTTETVNPGAWMAGFNDVQKGYVSTKGFKDANSVIDSYIGLEKLLGGDRNNLLKMPEKIYDETGTMTPEGRAIAERLGAPKDAKGYEVEKFQTDPEVAKEMGKAFQEMGLSKTQADKLMKWDADTSAKQKQAMMDARVAKFRDQDSALQKTWGAAYEQNLNIAKQAVARLGHDAKTIDAIAGAIGHDQAMKLYHQLGTAVGEGTFISGKSAAPSVMDPAQAKAQINTLKSDKGFMEKFFSGDTEAKANWTRLHQMAFPGEISGR